MKGGMFFAVRLCEWFRHQKRRPEVVENKNLTKKINWLPLVKMLPAIEQDEDLHKSLILFRQRPSDVVIINKLALGYLQKRRFKEARLCARESLEFDKGRNMAWVILAKALFGLSLFPRATFMANKGLEHFPGNPDLLEVIVFSSFNSNLAQQTVKALNKLKRRNGKLNSEQLNILAISHQRLGDIKSAIKHANHCINLYPDYSPTYNTLGNLYSFEGKKEQAMLHYAKCVELSPASSQAVYNFTRNKKFNENDSELVKNIMEKYHDAEDVEDKIYLGFALSKISEDLKDFESAANFWIAGGRLHQKRHDYDFSKTISEFKKLREIFPKENLNLSFKKTRGDQKKPIFIVGMPRSGTSLLEQMVSNHSAVTGLGELNFVSEGISSAAFAEGDQDFERSCAKLRKYYFQAISMMDVKTEFFTDKLPSNIRFVSAILNAMPEAKVISINREPEAVCFSCFLHNFPAEGLAWTFDQYSVANYYHLQMRHLEYLKNKFKDQFINVHYENIIDNPEEEMQKILRYCELPFELAVTTPETNTRKVLTASVNQATQKIYKGSSEKWKTFEPYLPVLFSELEKYKPVSLKRYP